MKDSNENIPDLGDNPKKTEVSQDKIYREKFENKLTQDDIVERAIESLQLFKDTEDLIKKDRERKEKQRKEKFQLGSGEYVTIESLTTDPAPYISLFGYDVAFFEEMYKVCDIDLKKWTLKSYNKPPIIGILINEFIWRRLGGKALINALRSKAFVNGERRYKFSQFLTQDDKDKIIQYRDDAIKMAKEFERGRLYEFRKRYAIEYRVEGFQYRLEN